MTFFLPPKTDERLPVWRFAFLKEPGFTCPNRTWVRGQCDLGTLLAWAPRRDDGSCGVMQPANAREDAIAIAVELVYCPEPNG